MKVLAKTYSPVTGLTGNKTLFSSCQARGPSPNKSQKSRDQTEVSVHLNKSKHTKLVHGKTYEHKSVKGSGLDSSDCKFSC